MSAFDRDELTRRRDALRLAIQQMDDSHLSSHTKDRAGYHDDTQLSREHVALELATIEARLEALRGPADA